MQKMITLDVFDEKGNALGIKNFYTDDKNNINRWRAKFPKDGFFVCYMISQVAADMQNNNQIAFLSKPQTKKCLKVTDKNLIFFAIYLAVRHAIKATWLNDRDQFLYPNDKWQEDSEFQNDCLAFTLFHSQNRISSLEGTNHFIPFSESEVGAKEAFQSHFMQEFIKGKISHTKSKKTQETSLFPQLNNELSFIPDKPLKFSPEAEVVFEKGLALYKYYHQSDNDNANASLYDIRMHFQGRNEKGDMKNIKLCENEDYKGLYYALSEALQNLAKKIEPKICEYGFLRQ